MHSVTPSASIHNVSSNASRSLHVFAVTIKHADRDRPGTTGPKVVASTPPLRWIAHKATGSIRDLCSVGVPRESGRRRTRTRRQG